MKGSSRIRSVLLVLIAVSCPSLAFSQSQSSQPDKPQADAQAQTNADVVKKLDQLLEQNKRLEEQNRELVNEIETLRQGLANQPSPPAPQKSVAQESTSAQQQAQAAQKEPVSEYPTEQVDEENADTGLPVGPGPEKQTFGTYTPNLGFTVADTDKGSMNVSIFTYFRYLNQLDLAPFYTNAFGVTSTIQRRQDFQLNKVQIKFLGWIFSPKFRYFLYVWTANTNQGLGAQVVAAGNLNYTFNKYLTVSAGVTSLPGTRSVEGNFPFWLGEDTRLIADEYFRPSYTQGIWARGEITDKLRYHVMLGDNLSILGVNAGQLPNHPTTFSSALIWMPTTGEFGPGFGDFEDHERLATRFAFHFTRSRETAQEQPGTETFENTQLRLSDGSIIFTPNLFGPGITINDATYKMISLDSGIKDHGFALEGEYFMRWLSNFNGPGTAGLPSLFDQGFQAQVSQMLSPKLFQLYGGGSTIFGQYGTPFDARIGINIFPFKNRVVRINTEGLYLYKSPVGYYAVPFTVGGKGWVFHVNWEMAL